MYSELCCFAPPSMYSELCCFAPPLCTVSYVILLSHIHTLSVSIWWMYNYQIVHFVNTTTWSTKMSFGITAEGQLDHVGLLNGGDLCVICGVAKQFKSSGMWYRVTGGMVPVVLRYCSAFVLWSACNQFCGQTYQKGYFSTQNIETSDNVQ